MTQSLILRCPRCGRYTLKTDCPEAHGATRTPHPARYSPEDRWGRFRRALYEADRAAQDVSGR